MTLEEVRLDHLPNKQIKHVSFGQAAVAVQSVAPLSSISGLPLLTQATSLTTSVCPATVIMALPSGDQILAVLSYEPVRIL